jgi:hypothetical protein
VPQKLYEKERSHLAHKVPQKLFEKERRHLVRKVSLWLQGKVRQPPHTLKKFYQFFTVGMSVGLVYMVSSAAGMCTCTCTGVCRFFDSVINLQFEVFKIQNLWFLINSNNHKH